MKTEFPFARYSATLDETNLGYNGQISLTSQPWEIELENEK